jgi:hypothetical protein
MEGAVYVAGEVKASSENHLSLFLLLLAFPFERVFLSWLIFFHAIHVLAL